jgi:hypothetical protein
MPSLSCTETSVIVQELAGRVLRTVPRSAQRCHTSRTSMTGPSSDLQQHAKASNGPDWIRIVGCGSKRTHRDEVPDTLKVLRVVDVRQTVFLQTLFGSHFLLGNHLLCIRNYRQVNWCIRHRCTQRAQQVDTNKYSCGDEYPKPTAARG